MEEKSQKLLENSYSLYSNFSAVRVVLIKEGQEFK